MQNSIDAHAEFEVLAVRKLWQLSERKDRLRHVFQLFSQHQDRRQR